MKKSNTVKEITPSPGAYDGHIKPFGTNVSSTINLGPTGERKPDERSEWLQSGQLNRDNTPGPGFYKGNDVDFGKNSRNAIISKSVLDRDS
jgi:hypothetical protein